MLYENKIKAIKILEKEKNVSNIHYDPDILLEREDSLWYGHTVLSYKYKKYDICIKAVGDCIGDIYYLNDKQTDFESIHFKNKSNDGISDKLIEANIKSDKDFIYCDNNDLSLSFSKLKAKLEKSNANAFIVLDYGNWFEIEIYDNDFHEYITDNWCFEPLDFDVIFSLSIVKDLLEEIEE